MLKKPRKTFLAIPDLLKQAQLRQKSMNHSTSIKENNNSNTMVVNNKASQLIAKSANKIRKSVPVVYAHNVSHSNTENSAKQYQKEQNNNKKQSSFSKYQDKENSRAKENRFIVKKNHNGEFIQPVKYIKQVQAKNSPQNLSMVSSQKKVKSASKMRFSHIHVLSQNYEQEQQRNSDEQQSYHSNQNSQLSTHQIESTSQIQKSSSQNRKNRYDQDQLDISNGIEDNLDMSYLHTQFEPKIIRQTKGEDEQAFYNDKDQMHLLASMFSKSNMFIDSDKWQHFLKRSQHDQKFQKALKNFVYSYFIQHYQ